MVAIGTDVPSIEPTWLGTKTTTRLYDDYNQLQHEEWRVIPASDQDRGTKTGW